MANHHAIIATCVTCGQTASIVNSARYPGRCVRCYRMAYRKGWSAGRSPELRRGVCEDCGQRQPIVRSIYTDRKLCRPCFDIYIAPRKQAGERRGWSPEMLAQLAEHYPTAKRAALLAMFPGRSWDAIQHAAGRYGIARLISGAPIVRHKQPNARQDGICTICGDPAALVASALLPGCCKVCYDAEYRRLRMRQGTAAVKSTAQTGICTSCGREAALVQSSVIYGALCYACYHVHYQQVRAQALTGRKEWMPDEIAQLVAHFEHASRVELFAMFPGRSWSSIQAAAQRHGLFRRNPYSNIAPETFEDDAPAPVIVEGTSPERVEGRERLTKNAAAVKAALHDLYVCERNILKWLHNVEMRSYGSAGLHPREEWCHCEERATKQSRSHSIEGGFYGRELSE